MSTLEEAAEHASEATQRFVSTSFDIADRIHEILRRQGKTQKQLAALLDKRESEISKWMTGQHNLTIKTICAIEAALGEDILRIAGIGHQKTYSDYHEEAWQPRFVADTHTPYGADFLDQLVDGEIDFEEEAEKKRKGRKGEDQE